MADSTATAADPLASSENDATTAKKLSVDETATPNDDDREMRNLFEVVRDQPFLHARPNQGCRMPLGKERLEMLQRMSSGNMLYLHMLTLLQFGAQPLVLRPLPPLLSLLLSGCGCSKCKKNTTTTTHPMLERGWALSYDVMMFYMAVLQSNAVFSGRNDADVAAKSGILRDTTARMAACQCEVLWRGEVVGNKREQLEASEEGKKQLAAIGPVEVDDAAKEMWAALDEAMRTDTDSSSRDNHVAAALLGLAGAMATRSGASYTLELIHKMECAVWTGMAWRAPNDERRFSLCQATAYWTPLNYIQPVGAIPEADKEVRDYGVKQQSLALRQAACGDENGCQFKQWPTVTIPKDRVIRLMACALAPDQCVPLDAACYSVLSFYYAGLLLAAPRIGAAQPDMVVATRKP